MRLIQTFIFILFLGSVSAQGVEFMQEDFSAALIKAKEENKLIFVDAYTTWCGPCKWMSKNVFVDEGVGKLYNKSFVNLKLDMEKGQGLDFAKKYEIKAYPTLLFINGDGELVHQSLGGRPVEEFHALGEAALDPEKQVMTLTKRYEAGEKSPPFLKNYTEALTSAGMPNFGTIAEEYMNSETDWTTEDNMQFIFDFSEASMDSKLFQYTVEHETKFRALLGDESYDRKVEFAAEKDRSKAGIARNDIEGLTAHFTKYFGADAAKQKAYVTHFREAMYAKDPVEQEKFKAEIQLFLADTPDVGPEFYNSVAWQVFEITEDPDLLKKTSEWATISITGKENSYNTDTKAAIEYKLGNTIEALQYAEKSLALAKEEGADYTATAELIEKIKGKM